MSTGDCADGPRSVAARVQGRPADIRDPKTRSQHASASRVGALPCACHRQGVATEEPPESAASAIPLEYREHLERLADEHGVEAADFFDDLLTSALRGVETGILSVTDAIDPCESPRLVRDQLGAQQFGFCVSGDEYEPADAEGVLREELEREGLDEAPGRTREYAIGRGYSITTLLLLVAGGIVAFFAGIKKVDEGLPILGKWLRAIRRTAQRLGASGYTAEFIKGVCLEKALDAGTDPEAIDVERITATIQHMDIGPEADVMTGHWTVTIPISSGNALVYIVGQDGVVHASAELSYPEPDDQGMLAPGRFDAQDLPPAKGTEEQ